MPKLIKIGTKEEEMLEPGELAERWGCSIGHLANMRSQGKGCGYYKPRGGVVYYPMSEIVKHEEASYVTNEEVRDRD